MLLTSPWPESLYAFAPIWATLAERARLFAIDLPGVGASERREGILSPRAMGGFLAQLIAEAELDRPHIVAPDVGTAATLHSHAARAASDVVSERMAVEVNGDEPDDHQGGSAGTRRQLRGQGQQLRVGFYRLSTAHALTPGAP